jgi:hypothetical protein
MHNNIRNKAKKRNKEINHISYKNPDLLYRSNRYFLINQKSLINVPCPPPPADGFGRRACS